MRTHLVLPLVALVALVALVTAPLASATAQDVNTAASWNGADYARSWGRPNSSAYGQTFTAPTTELLTSFSFWLSNGPSNYPIANPGDLTFKTYVMAWDGTKATGPALYTSSDHSANASTSFQRYDFATGGVPLVGGQQYVAFLFADFPGANATNDLGYAGNAYSAGDFFYLNAGSNFSAVTTSAWTDYGGDLAFAAAFAPSVTTPEPSTTALVAAGVAGLAGVVRRRRRAAA